MTPASPNGDVSPPGTSLVFKNGQSNGESSPQLVEMIEITCAQDLRFRPVTHVKQNPLASKKPGLFAISREPGYVSV